MEALTEDLKQLTRTVVSELDHPPELDLAQHMEPIGELCQLCTHWEDRDRKIAALLGNLPAVSTVQQPMSDEFGDFSFLADVDLEEMISRPVPEVEGPPAAAQVAAPPVPVPSPAAHVSSPVAPANPGDQACFSARVLQCNSLPPKKKAKPNLLGGAERWGVRKALPDLCLSRVTLTRLTWEHKQLLV